VASYFVVFNAALDASSDALVGAKPIASTKVEAPLLTAKVAQVEAGSVAIAQEVVRATYGSSGTVPVVVISTQWKES